MDISETTIKIKLVVLNKVAEWIGNTSGNKLMWWLWLTRVVLRGSSDKYK